MEKSYYVAFQIEGIRQIVMLQFYYEPIFPAELFYILCLCFGIFSLRIFSNANGTVIDFRVKSKEL